MPKPNASDAIGRRKTFAIISHPDAGKTTLTEKLLLFGGAIQLAGSVKGRKADRHATSDWMALEQQRGISVSTAAMQFVYEDYIINLLDTPGHADFTEDTYRTLTAVDSALMVIDSAKGVESRTIKLMEVCRLRTTPIMTFINKMDREGRDPFELLDEIESVLSIQAAPVTWPIGMGKSFQGIYHLIEDNIYLYAPGSNHQQGAVQVIHGLDNPSLATHIPDHLETLKEAVELLAGAADPFSPARYLAGEQTPVFFGSAINNFGIKTLLDGFVADAPGPQPREAVERVVSAEEPLFSAFVFKIQANMDPAHRDRIAFLRIASGAYHKGMRLINHRTQKAITVHNALTFMAGERQQADEAVAGDIIGLHNHGTIRIGDTFTSGEALKFTGIPNFAPELFRAVRLKDPLKQKALLKGLLQLSEEGATQLFRPLDTQELLLGAIGVLQFDVVAYRLKHEYGVACIYESTNIVAARWLNAEKDPEAFARFNQLNRRYLATDSADCWTYLAPSRFSLQIAEQDFPTLSFTDTREY